MRRKRRGIGCCLFCFFDYVNPPGFVFLLFFSPSPPSPCAPSSFLLFSFLLPEQCVGNFTQLVNVQVNPTNVTVARQWEQYYLNFNNVGKALETLISLSTMEGWPQVCPCLSKLYLFADLFLFFFFFFFFFLSSLVSSDVSSRCRHGSERL